MSLFSRFRKAPTDSAAALSPATAPAPSPSLAPETESRAIGEESALRSAIASGDLDTVAKLVTSGSSTKIRQSAAEAIEDLEQIRALLRAARNDKNVHKILARKRDALLEVEREREKTQGEIDSVANALERHSHRPFDALFTPTLEQLELRWNTVLSRAAPEVVHTTQQAIDRAREVIAQHLRQIGAQAARELAAANEAATAKKRIEEEQQAAALADEEAARVREEQRKAAADKQAAETHALQQITGLVRKAHAALASGSSKSAAGMRRAIAEKLALVPHLPAHLSKQLKQLDTKLDELKDWKSFSVAPKRIELIERMEALIGADMHPTALVGQIKDLQEHWRTLNKGAGETDDAEWHRFHDAAQKAFEPCRAFYEEQDRIKAANLYQREQLFERLRAFEQRQNWEEPDWRTVITAVREAKQLWREHVPVDPSASEALQRKFNELTSSLQTRIDAEYARNVKHKTNLIDRARALTQSTDTRAGIEEAKRLQEKWKTIGPTPRDEDHRLWEEFRRQCDAIFQKRQEERATHTAQIDANKAQAIALCVEAEQIAQLAGEELLENAKRVPALRAAFDAIEELPKGIARQLRDRFDRALDRSLKAVRSKQAEDAERGWTNLLDAANQVRAYQLAVLRNAEAAEVALRKQNAEQLIENLAASPKRGLEILRNNLNRSPNIDVSANQLTLRTLCIRAEILTDAPTPESDQALRREHQVKRLMQSMGQGVKASDGELDALTFEWLGVGPVEEAVYVDLLERFKICRKRALRS